MIGNLFTYLRSTQVLIAFLVFFNIIAMLFLQKNLKFRSLAIINAFFAMLIGSELLVKEGYIVDELSLAGDVITTYIFLFTLVLFILGLVLFLVKRKKK